jgi:hypothetical protein
MANMPMIFQLERIYGGLTFDAFVVNGVNMPITETLAFDDGTPNVSPNDKVYYHLNQGVYPVDLIPSDGNNNPDYANLRLGKL